MTYTTPDRMWNGVNYNHPAFLCDAECDKGRLTGGDHDWEWPKPCKECGGTGFYSAIGCDDCGELLAPQEVRSTDNELFVLCGPCTEDRFEFFIWPLFRRLLKIVLRT